MTAAALRVLLRAPTAADEEAYTSLARRSRRFHAGLATPARDSAGYSAYLRRAAAPDHEPFVIERREDGVLLGAVTISQIFYGAFQSAYLGYWIGAPFAGRGYMREGVGLALDHAFGVLRLHRLEANIQPGNVPSLRLVQGLGFRLEGHSPKYLRIGGRWRDHERWAILRDEWRGARRHLRERFHSQSTH